MKRRVFTDSIQKLGDFANGLGLCLSESQLEQFARYAALIQEWNQKFNLTAITDEAEIVALHFADALTVAPVLLRERARCETPPTFMDVGTGAGFPGIPLKIALPEWRVWLVDSTAKKLRFCEAVVQALALREVYALHARAEELALRPEHREQYPVVVARAVAPLPTLVEYLLPLTRLGGLCIAMKGRQAEQEVNEAAYAIEVLGGVVEALQLTALPQREESRALVLIRKLRPTPRQYPRAGGAPRNRPLKPR